MLVFDITPCLPSLVFPCEPAFFYSNTPAIGVILPCFCGASKIIALQTHAWSPVSLIYSCAMHVGIDAFNLGPRWSCISDQEDGIPLCCSSSALLLTCNPSPCSGLVVTLGHWHIHAFFWGVLDEQKQERNNSSFTRWKADILQLWTPRTERSEMGKFYSEAEHSDEDYYFNL